MVNVNINISKNNFETNVTKKEEKKVFERYISQDVLLSVIN